MTKTNRLTIQTSQMMGRPITWTQLSLEAIEGLRDLMTRNNYAASLLLALIAHMKPGSGGVVVVSRTTMTELLDCSMPTVDRALKMLTNEGWVQRIKIGGAAALAINYRVAWTGPREHIQHAVFGATVIASRTEQDAIALNPPPLRQVPTINTDELPLVDGPGMDPPSQPELDGVPPLVAETKQRELTTQALAIATQRDAEAYHAAKAAKKQAP